MRWYEVGITVVRAIWAWNQDRINDVFAASRMPGIITTCSDKSSISLHYIRWRLLCW